MAREGKHPSDCDCQECRLGITGGYGAIDRGISGANDSQRRQVIDTNIISSKKDDTLEYHRPNCTCVQCNEGRARGLLSENGDEERSFGSPSAQPSGGAARPDHPFPRPEASDDGGCLHSVIFVAGIAMVAAIIIVASLGFARTRGESPQPTSTPIRIVGNILAPTRTPSSTPTQMSSPSHIETSVPTPTSTQQVLILLPTPTPSTKRVHTKTPTSVSSSAQPALQVRTSTPVPTNTPKTTHTSSQRVTPIATIIARAVLSPTYTSTPLPTRLPTSTITPVRTSTPGRVTTPVSLATPTPTANRQALDAIENAVRESISKTRTATALTSTRIAEEETASPLAPNATWELTGPPNERHLNEKEYMLELINSERKKAELNAVVLGDNIAAQLQAESALENCSGGHWGIDGLKNYMRYSLARGYQSNQENANGYYYCLEKDEISNAVRDIREEVRDAMDLLMNSSGHRKTILSKSHRKVNIGLALGRLSPLYIPAI